MGLWRSAVNTVRSGGRIASGVLQGGGTAVKTAAVGGATGYVAWETLVNDKPLAKTASEMVIGSENTEKLGSMVDSAIETVNTAAGTVKDVAHTASDTINSVGNAFTGGGSADGQTNQTGVGDFIQGISSGNGLGMIGDFFRNIGEGKVSGMSFAGLIGAAFLIFGRFGWLGKIAGAKAVSHNLPGFNKEKISAALMAQGASYVRFYNTDGLLRYRPDDAYFANKSVYAARLNGKEVNVTANFDVSDAVHRATHQIFDRQQMVRTDDGKWLLYMKPEGQNGFAVEPSKEDVKRFFTAVKTGDQARTREVRDELAQKYYAEAVANPGMKLDIFTLAPDDVDLSLIDRVNIFRTKDDKIVCLATIQGVKGLQPMEMTKPQWEKMWIADDVKAYKNQVAGLLYADTLRQVATQRQEVAAQEKETEEQKKADEAKRQDEARRKAEEQKRKDEETKKEKKPDPIAEAVNRGVAATIALSLLTQYDEMKKKHPDAVLLFRKGDDYVVVKDDAPKASEILGIPLKQEESEGKSCDYATFRHHDLDTYLPKLVRAGERVAICEQLEDPALKKGNRVERGGGQAMASEPTSEYKVIGSVPGIKQDNNEDNGAHVGFHR